MKFKGLLFATVAMAGLAACSSDNEAVDGIVGTDKDLTIKVGIPNSGQTRGIVEDGITSGRAMVDTDNVWAYLIRGSQKVAKQKVYFDGTIEGTARFINLTIGENDKVVVSGNADVTTPVGYEIAKVQPTATLGGVKSVLYYDSKGVNFTNIEEASKTYKVEMTLEPQAARTEVSGAIKVNPKLVVSTTVDKITPNNYRETFASGETFKATIGNFGQLALENKASDTDKFYDKIATGTKVIANHLFNGDEKRITFRLNATIYDVVKINNIDEKTSKNQLVDAAKPQSYIFKGKNDKYYVESDPMPYEPISELFELEESNTGTIIIGDKKYVISTNQLTDLTQIKTYTTAETAAGANGIEAPRGYFQLVKFAALRENGLLDPKDTLDYEPGKIYKISFAKIDWNKDGKVNDQDHFSPGDGGQDGEDGGNGGTDPTPTDNKYDVAVGAKILDWTIEEVGSALE